MNAFEGGAVPRFVLYLVGDTDATHRLDKDVRQALNDAFGEPFDLTLIDVLADWEAAFAQSIFVTPTLCRVDCSPELRMIGDLSNLSQLAAR